MDRKSPYLLLVIATCLWGGNFVMGKVLVTEIPPIVLALLRWTVALMITLPLFGKQIWQQRKLFLKHWKTVVFLALTGVTGFNTFTYVAVQYTGSINAALMNSAAPIIIVVLSMIFLGEKFSVRRGIGILISMAGVLWIITRGSWAALTQLDFNRGDLWMILAVALWAAYSIGVKKIAGQLPPNALLALTVIITVIVLFPIAMFELTIQKPLPPHSWTATIVGILYIGIFASIVAFLSWNKAVAIIGPSRSANFLNLIPLFSAIFAILFTGEHLAFFHFAGAFLILLGVYVTTRTDRRAHSQPLKSEFPEKKTTPLDI
ncbi:DMT family transporter [Ferviditalea candida]|uniref:DMT family transporter n=1 Tax=Ferviditalea candida TaxID=3108399 RepID=A0ABU5ZHC3_9BACL|nr:DMT family transporter [Paenibacillaceae bacterium T2]